MTGDLTATVLEKILDLLDRVKLVEKENERLLQRVGNLEAMQDKPVLVPDQDPDELPSLTEEEKKAAFIMGVTQVKYQQIVARTREAMTKEARNLARQQQVLQASISSQAQAGLAQQFALPGAAKQIKWGDGRDSGGLGASIGIDLKPKLKPKQKSSMLKKILGRK